MPHPATHFTSQNRLLAALPRLEYERLRPAMHFVQLAKGKLIYDAGDLVRHAYFMTSGMVSLLARTEDGEAIEVAMVGNEGMVGVPVVLGTNLMPYRVMVQIPGGAMKLTEYALREEINRNGQLHKLLLCYTHTVLAQITQSALCNRFHTLEERLCRWLLIARDRVKSDGFEMTQEFLSDMLGAPRTAVTKAAGNLQKKRLIRYSRGRIKILDRLGLESTACECYRIVTEEIAHLIVA